MGRRSSSAVRDDASRLTRQLSLDLKRRTHGGARPGAGRPRKADKDRTFIAHRARPSHRKGDPVHVTLRAGKGIPSFRRQAIENLVRRSLERQRNKLTVTEAKHFQVVHFTIQGDHLHLIVESPDKRGLARGVAGLEVRIAQAINKLLKRKGGVWKERYHRRDLRTPTEVRNALRYVLLNSQKHIVHLGDRNFADPFSSAASFDGFARAPFVFDDPSPWERVEPRTCLLGKGWRRRGLIDPADLPPSSPHAASRAWHRAGRPRRSPVES